MEKILVGLSGGVDSAVSAYLLKEQWYDVTAGFMINYLADEWEDCPTREDIKVAREVAQFLDIPFFIFDYREEYEKKVLDYMYEWYKNGVTPNPDIMCNSEIKFRVFLDEALELGYDKIATGHYAQIKEKDWYFHLKKWVDVLKDQSYFLAWLSQDQLSKSIFPIGHIDKSEVRKIAQDIGLPNALRKDSQWICFVGKVNMADFLEKKIQPKNWNIVDTEWNILGIHKWVFYFTVWQRKWLDFWWQKEPMFVIKKDILNNEIVVWNSKDLWLYSQELHIEKMHFLWERSDIQFPLVAKAKVRYRQNDQECSIEKNNDWFIVKFIDQQRAIASWQVCTIYQDNILIMSWVIN